MDSLNQVSLVQALCLIVIAGFAFQQGVMQGKPVVAAITLALGGLGWWFGASL